MSRQAKPDNVDVLHYRLYTYDRKSKKLTLSPKGGMTLAVKWPDADGMKIAIAHCSARDSFVNRTGYDKAIGRFISGRGGHVVNISAKDCAPYFAPEPTTFHEKCKCLHEMIVSNMLRCYIIPDLWVDVIKGELETVHLFRTSSFSIEFDDPQEAAIDAFWTGIEI